MLGLTNFLGVEIPIPTCNFEIFSRFFNHCLNVRALCACIAYGSRCDFTEHCMHIIDAAGGLLRDDVLSVSFLSKELCASCSEFCHFSNDLFRIKFVLAIATKQGGSHHSLSCTSIFQVLELRIPREIDHIKEILSIYSSRSGSICGCLNLAFR